MGVFVGGTISVMVWLNGTVSKISELAVNNADGLNHEDWEKSEVDAKGFAKATVTEAENRTESYTTGDSNNSDPRRTTECSFWEDADTIGDFCKVREKE